MDYLVVPEKIFPEFKLCSAAEMIGSDGVDNTHLLLKSEELIENFFGLSSRARIEFSGV